MITPAIKYTANLFLEREELSLDAVQRGDLKAYAWLTENYAEPSNEPLDPRDQDDDN